MACTSWRGVSERVSWMLDHPPGQSGMCARETWQALGGDKSPPCPPAWGTPNANAVYDEILESGRYWTSTPIPDGAVIAWKYGANGHLALAWQGGICTTDPTGDSGGTGLEPLSYPEKWGASASKRIWTDQYNGVRFDVGSGIEPGPVYLSKLVYGQEDSDSVKRLQQALNAHPLDGGETLPITGNYLDETDEEVRLCQAQHDFGSDPAGGSSVGPKQAEHLFAGTGNDIINDLPTPVPPEPEEPDEPSHVTGLGMDLWYSGKPSGNYTLHPDGDWHQLFTEPGTGVNVEASDHRLIYLRVELPKGRSADRVLETKFVRADGDATAYDSVTYGLKKDSMAYVNVHFEEGGGSGGSWWVKVSGGTDPVTLTTRYCKRHSLWQDEAQTAAGVMSATFGLSPGAARLLAALTLFLAVLGVVLGVTG